MHPTVAADLEGAFEDPFATVAVSIGAVSTRGFENLADQTVSDEYGESGQKKVRVISIRTGTLGAGLVEEATMVVEGVNRQVREIALADDGLVQHVVVAG